MNSAVVGQDRVRWKPIERQERFDAGTGHMDPAQVRRGAAEREAEISDDEDIAVRHEADACESHDRSLKSSPKLVGIV